MKITIIGLQGSGKTYLTKKFFLDKEKYHLVVDPNEEYAAYNQYIPNSKAMEDYDSLNDEIKLMLKKLVMPNIWSLEQMEKKQKDKDKRLKLLVFDEADLIMPARKNLNYILRSLWVKQRHYRVDLITITRRPTDLNAYIMDTSDYLIVFQISGANALRNLRNMNNKCQDAIMNLNYLNYEFLLFDRARNYKVRTLETLQITDFK